MFILGNITTYLVDSSLGEAHQEVTPIICLTQHHLSPTPQGIKRFLHHPRFKPWYVGTCGEEHYYLISNVG